MPIERRLIDAITGFDFCPELIIEQIQITPSIAYQQNPVATGFVITDNYVIMPNKATITGFVDVSENENAYRDFLNKVYAATSCTINCQQGYFTNMYISEPEGSEETGSVNGVKVSIPLTQVLYAKVTMSKMTKGSVRNGSDSSTMDRSFVQKKTPTPQKQSLLLEGFKGMEKW